LVPQHPSQHRPEGPVFLAVDLELDFIGSLFGTKTRCLSLAEVAEHIRR
jgi:hypothetical protein